MTDQRRRILSLDGGGIRGIISIEILAEIERQIRESLGAKAVLADFFDFFAGTSTGAITATALALRWDVDKIRAFYRDHGKRMFDHAHWWKQWRSRYDGSALKAMLKDAFGEDTTLGNIASDHYLMLVMRNVTTDQPWIVSNNPSCRFNRRERADCQLDLPLWQLVRASTAAPGFFPPETIKVGEHEFVFVDGSISSFTNPAFYAFLRAVAKPYDIGWKAGENNILLVSVGTGSAPKSRPDLEAGQMNLLHHATSLPGALMNAASAGWDMACRVLGEGRFGPVIDREFGNMVMQPGGASNWTGPKQFAYVRYDPDVTQQGLRDLGLGDVDAAAVQQMDSVEHIDDIQKVGRAYAGKHVRTAEHLRGFLA